MERRPLARGRVKAPLDFDDVIYGIHAVSEALEAGESILALHVASDRARDPALRALLSVAEERGLRARFEGREFFARLPYKAHQGVVARSAPFPYADLEDVLTPRDGAPLLVVIVDHLTDPHNVGAIVRTAACIGANGVVLPDRRSAGVNATVRKAAAGATARIPIAQVTNIAQTIASMKKRGLWIAGAEAGEGALPMYDVDLRRDLALVIGAEGSGLAPLVARNCDFLVKIPMLAGVASLNASVAAGVLLYEALRQRRFPVAAELEG